MTITEFKQKMPKGVSLTQILFQTDMVQGVINHYKTLTRRLNGLDFINENPNDWRFMNYTSTDGPKKEFLFQHLYYLDDEYSVLVKCPYGKPGDILWVRETWQELVLSYPNPQKYVYAANVCSPTVDKPSTGWRPSIHMPFEACRLFLRIKSIRVERLQDISEEDAIAEGVKRYKDKLFPTAFNGMFKNYIDSSDACQYAHASFNTLWQSINGIESLEANPWVFVIEFEKVTKEEILS